MAFDPWSLDDRFPAAGTFNAGSFTGLLDPKGMLRRYGQNMQRAPQPMDGSPFGGGDWGSPALAQQPEQAPADTPPPMLSPMAYASGGGDNPFGPAPQPSPEPFNWERSLNNAGAWLMANDTGGKSLSALREAPKDAFSLTTAPDGSMVRLNARKGTVEHVAGPAPKVVKIGTGPLGDIQGVQIGSRIFTMEGRLISDAGAMGRGNAPGGGTAATGNSTGDLGLQPMLKPGVQYDDALKGDEWLDQFKPEYSSAVRAYQRGEAYPSARGKLLETVKGFSQRYGTDLGDPMDDTKFRTRNALRTELAKTQSPSTVGGGLTTAEASMGHLHDTLKRASELNNLNILGLSWPSHLINSIQLTEERSRSIKALQDAGRLFGGEITKFYAGRGTGEERKEAAQAFADTNLTPGEYAERALTQVKLLRSKVEPMIARIEKELGPAEAQAYRERLDAKVKPVEDLAEYLLQQNSNEAYVASPDKLGRMSGEFTRKLFLGPESGAPTIKSIKRIGD